MATSTPLYNNVKESSTTTGTGAITLAGAVTGYRSFAVVGNGNTVTIEIIGVDASGRRTGQWEICQSVYTASGTTLSRGRLIDSSTGSRITFSAGTKHVLVPAAAELLQPRSWNFVTDFGGDATGATDMCATLQTALTTIVTAGGGILFFPAGTYLFSGALQNTGTDNAQVYVPHVTNAQSQVTISLQGALPVPNAFQPDGNEGNPGQPLALPVGGYTIFKPTLTGQSGTAAFFGGSASDTTYGVRINNVQVVVNNIITHMPSNPTYTAWDLSNQQAGTGEMNLLGHCGAVDLSYVTQPTHSNAYFMKFPQNNRSAGTRTMGRMDAFGFYIGYQIGENGHHDLLNAWGCIANSEVPFFHHSAQVARMGVYWCTYGVSSTGAGARVLLIGNYDAEHANSGGGHGAAWQDTIADVLDAGNLIYGNVRWWNIQTFVGVDHSFVKSGGTHVVATEAGAAE